MTLRKTLEGLSGLDAKLERMLASKKPSKKQPKDSLEPSIDEGGSSNLDDYEIDGEEGEDELGDDDEEMEHEEASDDLSNVVDDQQLLTRAEERELRATKAEQLGEKLRKIEKDDVKGIIASSKAPTKKERAELQAREEERLKREKEEALDK